MPLIDTHAHLNEDAFAGDAAEVLARAVDAGVSDVLVVGITRASSERALALAEEHANVHAVVGVQPNYVHETVPDDKAIIRELASHPRAVAVGETGLDRYWDHAPLALQREWFDWHLALAEEVGKPFVIHCREADAEVVEQLRAFAGDRRLCGVMHSFAGDRATADACLALGLHLSFSGMLTYSRNDELRAVAAEVPADRLLVETDSPYLTPHPLRGKQRRNEPALVVHTAAVLAEVRGVTAGEIADVTTANARRLFRLPAGAPPVGDG